MKKIGISAAIVAIILVAASCCDHSSAEQKECTVKEALAKRHSTRKYSDKAVSNEIVLDILWAANGSNIHGKRTAPSAINAQDILLYVCNAEGVSRYDAKEAKLEQVTSEDIRPVIQGRNKFVLQAPFTILLVSDLDKFGTRIPAERKRDFALLDAGIVSQNISLYTTAIGLGTVCCAPGIDLEAVRTALKLTEQQLPILYHPVGYEAE